MNRSIAFSRIISGVIMSLVPSQNMARNVMGGILGIGKAGSCQGWISLDLTNFLSSDPGKLFLQQIIRYRQHARLKKDS